MTWSFYTEDYFHDIADIAMKLDRDIVEKMVEEFHELRERKGRLFIIGVGGSAANASHAVNDFRKICRIDASTPTDNVAELTARTNDDGWADTFVSWLKCSHLSKEDMLLVLSVGGGSPTVSPNIMHALQYAAEDCIIFGIVGRFGGMTAKQATICLTIPSIDAAYVESFQSVVLHLIVNHPRLKT